MRKIAVKILFLFAVAYGIIVLIYNRNVAENFIFAQITIIKWYHQNAKSKSKTEIFIHLI